MLLEIKNNTLVCESVWTMFIGDYVAGDRGGVKGVVDLYELWATNCSFKKNFFWGGNSLGS